MNYTGKWNEKERGVELETEDKEQQEIIADISSHLRINYMGYGI